METENGNLLFNHGFEISRVAILLIISVLLGVAAYVWTSTVTRLESEISFQRVYSNALEERLRAVEITNERQTNSIASINGRLDAQSEHIKELSELYYGPYKRKP